MKRKWIIGGIVATPFIVAIAAIPIFARARENGRWFGCQNNLKQIALAMAQYAKDFDDQLPPVALHSADEVRHVIKANGKAWKTGRTQGKVPPFGWSDSLFPYTRNTSIYNCPSEVSYGTGNPTERGYTVYWLNANVAGEKRATMKTSSTLMNGDGNSHEQSDARYSKSALLANLAEDRTDDLYWQPAWPLRHLGGANYAFLDGHVKWLKPGAVSTAPGAAYTFAPH